MPFWGTTLAQDFTPDFRKSGVKKKKKENL